MCLDTLLNMFRRNLYDQVGLPVTIKHHKTMLLKTILIMFPVLRLKQGGAGLVKISSCRPLNLENKG